MINNISYYTHDAHIGARTVEWRMRVWVIYRLTVLKKLWTSRALRLDIPQLSSWHNSDNNKAEQFIDNADSGFRRLYLK